MRFGVGGLFEIFLNGESVCSFHNHVTDYGLNTMVTKSIEAQMARCHVGSGNTAPADSDTALDSQVAYTTSYTTNTYIYVADSYVAKRRKFTFGVGVAEGTLTEVGVSDGTSLFNRQLFKDYLGNDTSIVVGASDTLDVLCEIRIYMPQAHNVKVDNSDFTVGSVDYASNYSITNRFYYSAVGPWETHMMFPGKPLNYLANSSLQWRISRTTTDYSSGDSGQNVYGTGNYAANTVTQKSYVTDSFELEFDVEWTAGTLPTNNYDVLAVSTPTTSASYFQKLFDIGISPGYNMYENTNWAASTSYDLGDKFTTSDKMFVYEVITAGTSHTSAPTWPTTVGGTVTDGNSVEYECVAPLLKVTNTQTLKLTVKLSWGRET